MLLLLSKDPTDNVGKSTLIQNIKNEFNQTSFHALHYSAVKQKTAGSVQDYSSKLYYQMFDIMYNINREYQDSGVICDRSHLGEMVYGPIYRDYTGEYVLEIEENFMHDTFWDDVYLITLYDEPENLVNRDDGLSFTTDLAKKKVEIDNFKNAHKKSNIKNKMLLNIKYHNEDQAIKAVKEFIERGIHGID